MSNTYVMFKETVKDLTAEENAWFAKELRGVDEFGEDEINEWVDHIDDCYGGKAEYWPNFDFTHGGNKITFESEDSGDPSQVAALMHHFLREFRPKQYFALSYSIWCDKRWDGHFGGGALYVTATWIQSVDAFDWLENIAT